MNRRIPIEQLLAALAGLRHRRRRLRDLIAAATEIADDTDVGLVAAGYLVVAFALTYAIGAPILTALTGTRDRRIVLAGSALVFAAGALGASLSHGYAVLLASRMVIACAAGLYAATAQATAVAISTKDHRARAISVIVGGTSLAVAFGAPLGAFIASVAGWRGTYVAIAAAGFLAAGAIWVMVPSGLRGEKLPLRARLTILAQPSIAPALATTLLYMTGGFAVLTYIAPMAIQAAGFSLLPAIFLIYGVGAAIGNYVGGQAADRWGAERVVMAALILNTGMLALFSLLTHLPVAWIGPSFLAMLLPWGVMSWSFPPAQASRMLAIAPASAPWRSPSTARRSIWAWRWAPSSAASSCNSVPSAISAGWRRCFRLPRFCWSARDGPPSFGPSRSAA